LFSTFESQVLVYYYTSPLNLSALSLSISDLQS